MRKFVSFLSIVTLTMGLCATVSVHAVEKKTVKTKTTASAKKPATKKSSAKKVVSTNAISSARHTVNVSRTSNSNHPSNPGLRSGGAFIINTNTGAVIYEKNADEITPIASITKLMTAMVVLDANLPLNEVLTITNEDVDTLKGTTSRLAPGTQLTRGEMLLLALMSSENRAASALSRHYPGGRDAFIYEMNHKAMSLGMERARFYDATGLNPNNAATPRELALMVQAARNYPEIHQFTTSSEYSLSTQSKRRALTFHNTNPLVKSDSWDIGLSKTGFINEAGRCLVMQARINDEPVVIVLMDSDGKLSRIGDANRVKKWIESNSLVKSHAG